MRTTRERGLTASGKGGAAAWSLSVDSKAKTGIFIDGGKRLSGAFLIDEIVARGVRFHIGAQQFTMHFQCSDSARLSVGDGPDFGMQKVK